MNIGDKARYIGTPEQDVFDLQLFYDQLVDGQIVKESDGEPWPLTKSEANQICNALSERLKVVWPLRLAQPATAKQEGYPGQAFFHEHNPNIAATERRADSQPTSAPVFQSADEAENYHRAIASQGQEFDALEKLRPLGQKATPGYWTQELMYFSAYVPGGRPNGEIIGSANPTIGNPEWSTRDDRIANAAFIVACVNFVRSQLAAGKREGQHGQ